MHPNLHQMKSIQEEKRLTSFTSLHSQWGPGLSVPLEGHTIIVPSQSVTALYFSYWLPILA